MTHLFAPEALPIIGRRDGREIILDSFAGGGGASTGIFLALGRHPDVAINHSAEAVALHAANHPTTKHHCQSVWQVDPADIARHGPIGLAWFSPDCKHFSRAKGGTPLEKRIRDLAWIVVAYARLPIRTRPRIICLENVPEFQTWTNLDSEGQPDKKTLGSEFRRWVGELRRLGYAVEWRELRACDYGSPTIRKRLFLVARNDGEPIVWPDPTHGAPDSADVLAGLLLPWRTAADIIDFSIPCPSIFLSPEEAKALGVRRPLQDATLRRIAQGLRRYVLDSPRPFIVPLTHRGDDRCHDSLEPLRTITTAKRGELALVSPYCVNPNHTAPDYTPFRGFGPRSPVGTLTASPGIAVSMPHLTRFHGRSVGSSLDGPVPTIETHLTDGIVLPWMAQHNTGVVGHSMHEPVSTILGKGCTQMLAAAWLSQMHGTNTGNGGDPRQPLGTILAQGNHHAAVQALLERTAKPGQHHDAVVAIDGQEWAVADIGMRMLTPRELYNAQGFPPDYLIDVLFEGKRLSKASQVRMCGNSVCPDVAAALVRANAPDLARSAIAA